MAPTCRSGDHDDCKDEVTAGALRPVLYRVDTRDATVFAGVVVMLVVVSLLASFLPARRVAKTDPVKALATE